MATPNPPVFWQAHLYWSILLLTVLISLSSDLSFGKTGHLCSAMKLSKDDRKDEDVYLSRQKRIDTDDYLSREKRIDTDGYLSREKRKDTDTAESAKVSTSESPAPNSLNNINTTTTVATTSPQNTTEAASFMKTIQDNSGMLLRAMYVLLGVTGIVVVYFVVRAVR